MLLAIWPLSAAADPVKLLRLSEMKKRMEASTTASYVIQDLSELKGVKMQDALGILYPQLVAPVANAQVEVVNGKRKVVAAPCGPAEKKIEEAEGLFQRKEFGTARKLYDEAIALAPACYVAHAYRGDADLFAGDAASALGHYDRALVINPDDASVHFFRSTALRQLGRTEEMKTELRWAMALRPRNPTVLQIVNRSVGRLGLRVEDVGVNLWGFARKEGDSVGIYFDEKQPAWLGYALCKGFWLGDPDHRREMTGSTEVLFTLEGERECLVALLTAYETEREKRTDETLERLYRIVESGAGDAWIVYELGSRVDPQIMLKVTPKLQREVLEFVTKYVMVDEAAPASSVRTR
ncbi:MAG TPA: hypothetical protein VE964_02255 [Myxococcales bacterium]|nr:hypothetical protein [Myxococcales bacterium]